MSMQNVAYMSFFLDIFLECTQFNVNNMIVYIGSLYWKYGLGCVSLCTN